ncbi:NTP transferase domain-containing protein [Cellulomonas sp. DKR-3]|uniref:NTP transferase domain-containing protein n=1 Tax=Cellulomonas fulva TaxID=2835530 RepID=A0ABS5TWC3_9CELL|nr:NTP transferase domain-containing protein [Cellulomonas fulva]MBT0993411.1 NTP transferase domain-containing protein [Cellulomonas fulva]
MTTDFDAIVLAGGAGRRLGGAVKPEVRVAGVALVDRALAAVAGARRVVLVAPPDLARAGVPRTLEDPPLGGPVSGVAAGLAALGAGTAVNPGGANPGRANPVEPNPVEPNPVGPNEVGGEVGGEGEVWSQVVVVLACDVPRAGSVVAELVGAARGPGVEGARLVDREGRPQHLVAAYRRTALERALARLGDPHGASVRALVDGLDLADVPDPGGAADDADTWDDVRRLDAELAGDVDRGAAASWDDRTEPPTDAPTDAPADAHEHPDADEQPDAHSDRRTP